jgi:ATP-dependent DNA helicase PIF1
MYEPLPEDEAIDLDETGLRIEGPAEAPEPPLVPTEEQQAAIDVLVAEPFVNLSGTAGVGKTFVAKAVAERVEGLALTSTTGIAAVNLGEGTTINSLIGYYDTNSLKELFLEGRLQGKLRALRKAGLRKILLDEKSMLDANQLTYLVRAIDEVNDGSKLSMVGEGGDEEAPSGEPPQLGLIVVGDFGQLPPVKAPFAFESPEWPRFADHTVKLSTIVRQSDRDFIGALHHVRAGRAGQALDYFTEDRFTPNSDDEFDGTTIFAKNDSVDRYNQLRLDQLSTRQITFDASRWGKQAGEWKAIPDRLELKESALVMILANRRETHDGDSWMVYANGDLGEIVTTGRTDVWVPGKDGAALPIPTTGALVRLRRNGATVMVKPVRRELTVPLEPGRRKELREQGRADLIKDKSEVIGTITYMPLRLAYASTVHKSQGLTLNNVQLNIFDGFFGTPSMLFTALSRARTPEGLRLVGTPRTFIARCNVNPAILPWI